MKRLAFGIWLCFACFCGCLAQKLEQGVASDFSNPQPGGKVCIQLQSEMAFGWFFRLFFTENRYRSLMEWRVQGVALNIKKRAEGDDSPNY